MQVILNKSAKTITEIWKEQYIGKDKPDVCSMTYSYRDNGYALQNFIQGRLACKDSNMDSNVLKYTIE